MTKQELEEHIKELLAKNKTEEALKLLSSIQLSENDTIVVILMSKLQRLQQDSIINTISREERNRVLDSINKSILDLSKNLNADEIKLNKKVLKKKKKAVVRAKESIESVSTPEEVSPVQPGKSNFITKNKKYLWLLLLIPLAYFVLRERTDAPDPTIRTAIPTITEEPEKTTAEIQGLLKSPDEFWQKTRTIYREDFTDRQSPDFRNDIWTFEPNSPNYWMGVENDAYYAIKIKNNEVKSRHKYIGKITYDTSKDFIAYKAVVQIDQNSSCTSAACLGRGITIDYHTKNGSAYAYTINDSGLLNFSSLNDFNTPEQAKTIFSQNLPLEKVQKIELGVANYKNNFYLFVDGTLIKELELDRSLSGKFCGVIACGIGNHLFDSVTLNK